MIALYGIARSCISPRTLRIALILAIPLLATCINVAQDDPACQTSDIEKSVFAAFAEYHTTLGGDSVGKAVQDVEILIESLRAIVSGCGDDTESDSTVADTEDNGSDDSNDEHNIIESKDAGEGTYADPVKVNWIRGDGEGGWVGVIGYYRWGSELCGRYCDDADPGNEFIAVYVYAKCDESRKTRCEFRPRSEFELAGQRRIPYKPEYLGSSYETLPLFAEEILPGGVSEGLVFFQAPTSERDFIFGWTPNYSSATIWFVAPELEE